MHRVEIGVLLFPVATILGGDLPARVRCVEPFGPAIVLFFLRRVEEQRHQIGAAINLLRFIVIAAFPVGGRKSQFTAL